MPARRATDELPSGRSLGTSRRPTRGAAFDPQEDSVIWPTGRKKLVAPRRAEEVTSRVTLQWFLPTRWAQAPETLLRLIRRRCPEALPTRYGRWEPLQHRFDPAESDAFVRYVLDAVDGVGFWFAARPGFGGSWCARHADRFVRPQDERLRSAHLEVDFDGRVLEQDPRWREAVVDLFTAASAGLGAFFGAVSWAGLPPVRSNRTSSIAGRASSSGSASILVLPASSAGGPCRPS